MEILKLNVSQFQVLKFLRKFSWCCFVAQDWTDNFKGELIPFYTRVSSLDKLAYDIIMWTKLTISQHVTWNVFVYYLQLLKQSFFCASSCIWKSCTFSIVPCRCLIKFQVDSRWRVLLLEIREMGFLWFFYNNRELSYGLQSYNDYGWWKIEKFYGHGTSLLISFHWFDLIVIKCTH